MAKPVCPNMATATPLGPPENPYGAEAARRVAQAGCATSAARIRLPEGAEQKASGLVRVAVATLSLGTLGSRWLLFLDCIFFPGRVCFPRLSHFGLVRSTAMAQSQGPAVMTVLLG